MQERAGGRVAQVDRDRLGRVLDTVRELGGLTELAPILDGVARAVCDVGGFGAVAVNVTAPEDLVVVRAVAGGADLLLGQSAPLSTWLEILERARRWRDLRYYRHDQDQSIVEQLVSWEPPGSAVAVGGADRWHPEDLLLAPMWAPDGGLIGVVSVDEPHGGRFPGTEQLTVLELLAAQAGRAIAEAARAARSDDRAQLFGSAFESSAAGMAIVDSDLGVVAANGTARALLGLGPEQDVAGTPFLALVHPGDVEAAGAACRDALRSRHRRTTLDCRLRRDEHAGGERDVGGTRWVRAQVARVDSAIHAPRLVLNLEDVTEARHHLDELRHQADHDALTGLPNRRVAYERVEAALTGRRGADRVVVLACDLDGFKAVNDRLGHAGGDELLIQVAERLGDAVRGADVVARLGGDEFLVVTTVDRAWSQLPSQLAERLLHAVRAPFALSRGRAEVTLSVGLAASSIADGLDAATIVDRADQALYWSKAAGRDRWLPYG